MDLDHSFTVEASAEETWRALTDVPRVARCMPGASLDEGSSDPYTGTVKVKVGAVAVKFRGELSFAELDESAHSLQLECRGKDVRGASGASALITMALSAPSADTTEVRVNTDLQLSGKIAQFGRGMLQDVSNAILQRFVSNLEQDLRGASTPTDAPPSDATPTAPEPTQSTRTEGSPSAAARSTSAGAGTARSAAAEDDDDMIDLGATVLPVLAKRYGPTALGGLALVVAFWALVRSFARPRTDSPVAVPRELGTGRSPLIVVHRWSGERGH